MNCEDFRNSLCKGEPIAGDAADHLQACPACRAMLEALDVPPEEPDPRRLELAKRQIERALTPVLPLPSDASMIFWSVGLFIVFSAVAASPFGFQGFLTLSIVQCACYYVVITTGALFFSLATVQEMVPGSRRRIDPMLVVGVSLVVNALLVVLLFPHFELTDFVHSGVPCLRFGVICAAVSAWIAYLFVRRGFFTSPVRAAILIGFFAGLAGVSVLALACRIQNASHILVWHLGAMLLSGLAGAVFGYWRFAPRNR